MGFEILEGVTSADIAFLARGESLEELFVASAGALLAVMLEQPASIGNTERRVLAAEGPDAEILLVNFLQEFLFYKDSEGLLLVPETVEVRGEGDGLTLKCAAHGEKIRRGTHMFLVDVKAVTMHRLSVERAGNEWRATVVLDV